MALSKDLFDISKSPFDNFKKIFSEVEAQGIPEPSAVTLATVDQNGRPSARVVLFKGLVRNGFSFYTNYDSQKAQNIFYNNHVSLVFFWQSLGIQIRVDGTAEKMSRSESEEYFKTRPLLSQLGAWASKQSQKIAKYEDLEKSLAHFEELFLNKEVPCPENWGGYLVKPQQFEFWFMQPGRLHHRYVYEQTGGGWKHFMKSP